ncbi:MAG: UTP--glucose-1-phosphate uridylyltransferase [Burkholderiales bacterium]|nr:UTP--glucose-1-phosphate uridylyltransferase [Burkholderiales bacterium]
MSSIRKAVFPVAGLGTRFLPATKAMPKEMLTVVDKPLIQYAVEEAAAAGITDMIFVTGRNKRAIEDHFDRAYELENELELAGKQALLDELQASIPSNINCIFLRQGDALGLGHAVLCAQPVVGNEPFAVILADELIRPTANGPGAHGATAQLAAVYARLCAAQVERSAARGGVIGVNYMPGDAIARYGAIKIADTIPHPDGDAMRLGGFVEKPKAAEAPSHYGAIGRYVLPAAIFEHLQRIPRGQGGEIQLTDAIATLAASEPVYAVETVGRRYDCGTKLGYLEATVKLGLERPEFAADFAAFLKQQLSGAND